MHPLRTWGRHAAVVGALASAAPLAGLAGLGARRTAQRVWCRLAARALGLRLEVEGPLPPPGTLVVANHLGYLDILALGATCPGLFLAKSEIAGWAGFGALARIGGVLFLERDRPRRVLDAVDRVRDHLVGGDRLILFPEAGVAPDGRTLQPFRPMLFEGAVRAHRPVVPAAIAYLEPDDPRVWAWIEETDLVPHLRRRLLPVSGVRARLCFGPPLWPRLGETRKSLALRARSEVACLLGTEG